MPVSRTSVVSAFSHIHGAAVSPSPSEPSAANKPWPADTADDAGGVIRMEDCGPVRVVKHVWIPMRDGVRLAARVWLPPETDGLAPVPAILEYHPYRKGDVEACADATRFTFFAAHGYAGVRVDLRGFGDSEGVLHDEYTAQELDDAVDVIGWIARQSWCSGKVGMMGYSWGGFNSLQVAALRPPGLGAVIAMMCSDDRYSDDVHFLGGSLAANLGPAWAASVLAFSAMPPDPATVGPDWRRMWLERLRGARPVIDSWLSHQRRDAYWEHGSVCEDYSAIQCPVYAVGGWDDGYRDAVFRLVERLKVPCKGLIGPWYHQYPQEEGERAIGFLQECVRWWDRWLQGKDNGIMNEPTLRMWLLDASEPSSFYADRPGQWVAEPAWPSSNVDTQTLFLNEGALRSNSGPSVHPGAHRVPGHWAGRRILVRVRLSG